MTDFKRWRVWRGVRAWYAQTCRRSPPLTVWHEDRAHLPALALAALELGMDLR